VNHLQQVMLRRQRHMSNNYPLLLSQACSSDCAIGNWRKDKLPRH
jgi:hypothetical protein